MAGLRSRFAVPALCTTLTVLAPSTALANRWPAPGSGPPPPRVAERLEALSRTSTSGGYLTSVTAAARCSVAAAAGRKVDCSTAVAGTRAIPVILATFENTGTPYSKTILREQLFGSWPTGTMTDYYEEVSYGALHVTGETYGWYSLPHPDAYYEGPAMCNGICEPEGKAAQFALDALAAADPDIDFRLYDNDGPDGMPDSGDDDGMVDFAALVHPETGGECENDNLWSHQVNLTDLELPPYETGEVGASGRKIVVDRYVLQPILSCDGTKMIEIGVFCHEFGHAFGLPDLYDVATFDPGVGVWSLMAAGGYGGDLDSPERPTHMDAWSKKRLGWLKPTKILVNTQGVALAQSETSAEAVELYWGAPVRSAEHFLIENRQPVGFDERLPRGGLLIYQIDDDRADEGNYAPCIDQPDGHCDDGHYGVALEQADGAFELEQGAGAGDGNDPFRPETQTEFSLC
ncbi:MAG: M6 family metalloprotease domain-containing protein, partial [Candidatus Methylomirabilis sp.]|nr:M6 family metalloprotease domain-containing protein [Deltaproteobacteria bacterium]